MLVFFAPSDWNRLVISENILTQVCSVTEARSDHPSGVSANSQPNSLFPVPQLSHTGVLTGANQARSGSTSTPYNILLQ